MDVKFEEYLNSIGEVTNKTEIKTDEGITVTLMKESIQLTKINSKGNKLAYDIYEVKTPGVNGAHLYLNLEKDDGKFYTGDSVAELIEVFEKIEG